MGTEGASVSQNASGLAERLKRDGKERVEISKRTVADHIREIADAIERAREHLEQTEPTLAAYAGRAAGHVSSFATRVRDSSLDDLLAETRQLARRNPGLYFAGAVAVGFVLARFIKSSAERSATLDYGDYGTGDYPGEGYSSGTYASSSSSSQSSSAPSQSPSYGSQGTRENAQDLDSRGTSEAVGTPGRSPTEGM